MPVAEDCACPAGVKQGDACITIQSPWIPDIPWARSSEISHIVTEGIREKNGLAWFFHFFQRMGDCAIGRDYTEIPQLILIILLAVFPMHSVDQIREDFRFLFFSTSPDTLANAVGQRSELIGI